MQPSVGGMHEQVSSIAHRNPDGTWSLRTYWYDGYDENGTPEYFMSPGFGEVADYEVAEDELPTAEQEAESWKAYAAFVAETGTDPLGNYMVDREVKFQELWDAQYVYDPAYGISLSLAQRAEDARWREPEAMPADVLLYLSVTAVADPVLRYVVKGFDSLAEFAEAARPQAINLSLDGDTLTVVVNVERRIPVPEAEVARQLRKLANGDTTRIEAAAVLGVDPSDTPSGLDFAEGEPGGRWSSNPQ